MSSAFQPPSYWDLADPGKAMYPEDWEETLLAPSISMASRRYLAGAHVTWLGGEDLPDYCRARSRSPGW